MSLKNSVRIHVYTSAYYPQGNGINESSHRGLEASIAAAARTLDVPFDDVLKMQWRFTMLLRIHPR